MDHSITYTDRVVSSWFRSTLYRPMMLFADMVSHNVSYGNLTSQSFKVCKHLNMTPYTDSLIHTTFMKLKHSWHTTVGGRG